MRYRDPSGLIDEAGCVLLGIDPTCGCSKQRREPIRYPISHLRDRFRNSAHISELVAALEAIQDEIRRGGGTVFGRWPSWSSKGIRCEEADQMVQAGLKGCRDIGWEYEHEEYNGWGWLLNDGDHNWGIIFGPNGEIFYVDFWLHDDTPILFEPPRGEHLYGSHANPLASQARWTRSGP